MSPQANLFAQKTKITPDFQSKTQLFKKFSKKIGNRSQGVNVDYGPNNDGNG